MKNAMKTFGIWRSYIVKSLKILLTYILRWCF